LVVKVPFVTVNDPEIEIASFNDQPPPTPLKATFPVIDLPLLEIVFPVVVESKFHAKAEPVMVIAEESVKSPNMVTPNALEAMVPVKPVKVRFLQFPVAVRVQVIVPDAASKNTSSALVGTDAPPGPPDVADHLVPAVPSQLAVPPTQKRSGICHLVSRRRSHHCNPVVHTFLFHGRYLFIA
jgi:hypothetical protein